MYKSENLARFRLLEAEDGSLYLWDPETGTLKQLIPIPARTYPTPIKNSE